MLTAIIDNYDSFTFNLVHYVLHTGSKVKVFRNDKTSINELIKLNPDAIVISPGPGRPENAGISLNVVKEFSGKLPLLGVCLGHQVIAASFGGRVIQAKKIMHGKTSVIKADGRTIYHGIKKPFSVMRYHSLAVSKQDLPSCLHITCETKEGEIMGLRHKEHQTEGVQFHPESFMTTVGKRIIKNFIKRI